MPKKHISIKVVKIPLRHPPEAPEPKFPHMPRMYLELIENKAKVKQDLINKEYVPSASLGMRPPPSSSPPNLKFVDTPPHKDQRRRDIQKYDDSSKDESPKKKLSKKFESRLDRLLSDDDSDDDSKSVDSIPSNLGKSGSPDSSGSEVSIQENLDDLKSGGGKDDDSNSEDSGELASRLKELLNDDSESEVSFDGFKKSLDRSRSDKYSRHRDKHGRSVQRGDDAPTLAELEARGGYVPRRELRDISHPTMNEQDEEDAKRELLFKFDLLRKSYPTAIIPDYTIHTDYHTMKKSYDDTVRRLSLDSTVENYKTYLIYGFMGCEFLFGNFMGFDMEGFTRQQILQMNSYEKLLIELGEKSYVPTGSKWPIELRLLFTIIMNAAFFIVSKMIMKKTGANLMGMINNMNAPPVSSVPPARKRRMRGPTVDLGDLPDNGVPLNI